LAPGEIPRAARSARDQTRDAGQVKAEAGDDEMQAVYAARSCIFASACL